jgi:hypothetical protein
MQTSVVWGINDYAKSRLINQWVGWDGIVDHSRDGNQDKIRKPYNKRAFRGILCLKAAPVIEFYE